MRMGSGTAPGWADSRAVPLLPDPIECKMGPERRPPPLDGRSCLILLARPRQGPACHGGVKLVCNLAALEACQEKRGGGGRAGGGENPRTPPRTTRRSEGGR